MNSPSGTKLLGSLGEELAFQYLRSKGYKILARNYECPLGELDIIARHENTLVFVEVKTRSSNAYGSGLEAVTFQKQQQIIRMAHFYLKRYKNEDLPCRFDVVSILLEKENAPQIDLVPNAFGES